MHTKARDFLSALTSGSATLTLTATLLLGVAPVRAQQAVNSRPTRPNTSTRRTGAVTEVATMEEPRIVVTGTAVPEPTPSHDDFRAKLDHIMREVDGTQITVTKKATAIKLELQPTVVNQNQQELYNKA